MTNLSAPSDILRSSLAEGASGPGSIPWVLAGSLAGLVFLAFVRLLSEIPVEMIQKGDAMNVRTAMRNKLRNRTRKYWQYLLETMWAAGAGVMVSPLAALS